MNLWNTFIIPKLFVINRFTDKTTYVPVLLLQRINIICEVNGIHLSKNKSLRKEMNFVAKTEGFSC